jgi:acyl-CoA synthetase (AMP-forming)/AMP-acid ligase II
LSSLEVRDWVFEHARRTPEASAIDSSQERISYAALAERIRAAAGGLAWLGVRPGDRVLVVLPNVPAATIASLAAQHVGAVPVEVSREWPSEQLALVAGQVRPTAVVLALRDGKKLAACCGEAMRKAVVVAPAATAPEPGALGASMAVVLTEGGTMVRPSAREVPLWAPSPKRAPDDVTLLLCTSGSTGAPRAVMQTIANIAANTRSIAQFLALTARDRAMLVLPLSYCYGRSVLQTHLWVGGSVVLERSFVYPRHVLDAMSAERCTGFAGVPLTFELLRRQVQVDMRRMPSLRYVTQAGGPMSPETTAWARQAFAPARLFVMYGQTEATARLAYLPPERASDERGAIGVPIAGVELRVVDDSGEEVAPHVRGNLVARGPNVTPGYYGAPEETARILRHGWLWTGDLAYRDDEGFFHVIGRAKDLLKIGGRRASPAQIEAALTEHGDVVEVAVAGLTDSLMGEVPAALVVVRPGARVTERDLQRFCGERLPAYLVPRVVRFAPELPRGPSGKVLREQVARAMADTRCESAEVGKSA